MTLNQITKNGIKANEEGHIFVFTNMIVADEIALNQCGLTEYAVFMIDSYGITGKVIRDRVAEFTASYHRIIIQEKISKRYIHLSYSKRIVDFNNPSPWNIFILRRLHGLSKADAVKAFYERRDLRRDFIEKRGGWLSGNLSGVSHLS